MHPVGYCTRVGPRRRPRRAWSLPLLALLVVACGDDPTGIDLRTIEFDPSLGVDLATFTELPSGVFYKDIVVGEGAAVAAGSVVDIGVEGWLSSGLEVQSWHTPRSLRLGAGQIIRGLEEGMMGMRVGGERRIVVPPHLAHEDENVMVFRLVLMAVY
jgi:peptidylprolyl isomerase